jgi:hypothetical protein
MELRLWAMQQTPRYAALCGVLQKSLSATPPYATQYEIQANNFLVDSVLYAA